MRKTDTVTTVRTVGRPPSPTDMRDRIVETTLRLMGQARSEADVTIARIVAEAGCTPPTLYHYWTTRDGLLAEASARGWERFRASQLVAPGTTAAERLKARGEAYLAFAVTQPQLFNTLFLTRSAPQPLELGSISDLVADVAEAMADGGIRSGDPQEVGIALWAAVHGVAALAYANPEFAEHLARSTLSSLTARLL